MLIVNDEQKSKEKKEKEKKDLPKIIGRKKIREQR